MDNFEEEVQYFMDLVKNNINQVMNNKPEGISGEEMIFFNWNMRKDGQEVVVYHQKKEEIYDIPTKKIKNFAFQKINKEEVLNVITLLKLYANKEISIKNLMKRYKEGGNGI